MTRLGRKERGGKRTRRCADRDPIEKTKPLDKAPALGWSGIDPGRRRHQLLPAQAAMQRCGKRQPDATLRVGWADIGNFLVALAVADSDAVMAARKPKHEMPFAIADHFARDPVAAHKFSEPCRSESLGRRLGNRDERAGTWMPDCGCFGGAKIRIEGERPTPSGARPG